MHKLIYIIALLINGFSNTAFATSFDCKKATTQVDMTICANAALGALDEDLASLYKQVSTVERENQRAWIRERNNCKANEACLTRQYVARIEQLRLVISEHNSALTNLVPPTVDSTTQPSSSVTKIPLAGESWIPKAFPFSNQELSTTLQAEGWALCSATLDVMSEIILNDFNKPNTATGIKNYANGASMAIFGVFVLSLGEEAKGLSEKEMAQKFRQVQDYAKFASKDYPEKAKTRIGALKENAQNTEQWFYNLIASAEACLKPEVLELQGFYIEIARSVALGKP